MLFVPHPAQHVAFEMCLHWSLAQQQIISQDAQHVDVQQLGLACLCAAGCALAVFCHLLPRRWALTLVHLP